MELKGRRANRRTCVCTRDLVGNSCSHTRRSRSLLYRRPTSIYRRELCYKINEQTVCFYVHVYVYLWVPLRSCGARERMRRRTKYGGRQGHDTCMMQHATIGFTIMSIMRCAQRDTSQSITQEHISLLSLASLSLSLLVCHRIGAAFCKLIQATNHFQYK